VNAWIVAVGSELLTPFRVDTNSLAITERLNAVGCDVRHKAVVGDDIDALSALFARSIGAIDLVVCTGGLGPTEDDVTRDALARALQMPLEEHTPILDDIRARFERRGLAMAATVSHFALLRRRPFPALLLESVLIGDLLIRRFPNYYTITTGRVQTRRVCNLTTYML
jgi:nicotinamide-nucleotide amidase